jgi:prolyl 4-hydroxylase
MAPTRPLMRGIRPPRVFSASRNGRASPYALALAALLVASACLLALIAFGVFSLPVSAPTNLATTGDTEAGSGGEVADSSSHPARTRGRRDLR